MWAKECTHLYELVVKKKKPDCLLQSPKGTLIEAKRDSFQIFLLPKL